MDAPLFIGDPVTATGYRLAGLRTRSPVADEVPEDLLRQALTGSEFLLLGADFAARLPAAVLAAALRGLQPLVVVVPAVSGDLEPPDLSVWLQRELGVNA